MCFESGAETIVCRRVYLAAGLARAVDRVAKRLCCLVGELSGTKCFEAGLPVVERVLRHFSGAIQFLFQSIE